MTCSSLHFNKRLAHVKRYADECVTTTVDSERALTLCPQNLQAILPAIEKLVPLNHIVRLVFGTNYPGVRVFGRQPVQLPFSEI